MPPFDFPASPAVGEVSNGYQWTGEMWGGAPKLGTDMSEQFFDLAGLSSIDIQVPVWAKGVQLIGNWYLAANSANQVLMRVSADGSTFFTGASDYYNGGGSHNTGTSLYQTNTAVTGTGIVLSVTGDDATFPHAFTAEMSLVRPSSPGTVFNCKVFGAVSHSAAASLLRKHWWVGWPSTAATSSLTLKALRLYNFAGTVGQAGSWLKVKWLGDIAQLPPSNGIADAPADGRSYERRNNLWVPAGLTFVASHTFAGKPRLDIPLPDGFKSFQLRYRNAQPVVTSANYLWCFGSLDGSTFAMTDGNYNWRMIYTASAGTTTPQWISAAGSGMGIVLMPLVLNATAAYNNSGILDIMQGIGAYTNVAINTQSFSSSGIFTQVGSGYYAVAGPWKAIRIQCGIGAGEAMARGDIDVYGFS